jgi:hypothetical protein
VAPGVHTGVHRGGSVKANLRILLTTLLLVPSPGCSLIFTKGPQPELHPPPECTQSVAAPVTDTVLATLSVALLGLGVAVVADTSSSPSCPTGGLYYCSNTGRDAEAGFGLGAIVAGAALGALFTASAVVGYQQTSACRASLEPNALLPQPKASLLPASPAEACEAVRDAPRVCRGLARRDESPGGKWPP